MDTPTGTSVQAVTASLAKIGQLGQQALQAETIVELRTIWELLCRAVDEHPLPMRSVPDFETFQRHIEAQRVFKASSKRGARWEYHGDDGSLITGQAARRKFDAHWARPHARTAPRSRGAGRPALRGGSRRSSAKSGDSGSDDGPSGEPPPRRLLCAYCGRPIPPDRAPQARYCSDRHADAERQRRKRQRERERNVTPRSSTAADYFRMLSFDPGELERLLSVAVCPCNGRHRSFGDDPESCQQCGRLRPGTVGGRRLLAQLDAVQAQLAAGRKQVVA